MINKQQQQPNLPSRQISLEEAKESQKFWTFSLEIIFQKYIFQLLEFVNSINGQEPVISGKDVNLHTMMNI